jgi:hypothetical protein
MLFDDFVFFDDFPDLVIEVYKAITTHGWDKTRNDVKFRNEQEVVRSS